jgi:hypothetical protein
MARFARLDPKILRPSRTGRLNNELQIKKLTETEYPETQALLKDYGVGQITALTYVLTLANMQRFQRSRDVVAT